MLFENGGFLSAVGGRPLELACGGEFFVDGVIGAVTWVGVWGECGGDCESGNCAEGEEGKYGGG